MDIRWAKKEDSKDLSIIHSESWKTAYKNIVSDEVLDKIDVKKREDYFKQLLKEKKKEIAVMVLDNIVIGFITLGMNRDNDLDDAYGEIWGIYLLPRYWNKGFGSILMNWGINKLYDRGYKGISLWVLEENLNARAFYEKLGFTCDGVIKEIKIEKILNEVRYIRHINDE
ncbi:GNAT family N-acetyltransferase [Senegalia massiliensis]|uniref:GNAT family N-acetyltransferase n=1 Tax=Senegalia massiliensis TaxID=1720316 RepID=UPI0010321438|nr:GNAT family N-acetyltransferase [Senegalia massiliensis]